MGKLSVARLIIVCEPAENKRPIIWPGALQREVWPLEDLTSAPMGQQPEAFREVRGAIEERVIQWLERQTYTQKESKYGVN